MDGKTLARTAVVAALMATFFVALLVLRREDRSEPPPRDMAGATADPATLRAGLQRCRALGPEDADDRTCRAIWEENRRRFFGAPPVVTQPTPAAPTVAAPGGAAP